jgi:hypothetical protein
MTVTNGQDAAERALHDYAWALDTRDWSSLHDSFTGNAVADFPGFGDLTRSGRAIVAKLRAIAEPLNRTQHTVTNVRVVSEDSDRVEVTACYQALHVRTACDPPNCTVAGFYRATLLRASPRWQIIAFYPDVVAVTGNFDVLGHMRAGSS